MAAKKLAKSLFDVLDDRIFYHSTDADFDFLRPNSAVRGLGIFGHESKEATAKYGKRIIPFKIRGKIAGQSPDELLNKKIEEAGLVPLADESSRDAYRRLIDQYPEQGVQSIFKSAGYGAFSRPTKKGDIVHAFDADSIIQMDDQKWVDGVYRHLEQLGVKPEHLKATAKVAIAGGALAAGEANAGMFGSLVKLGYPESTARKIADGVLPMDTESRMKRAAEQGYDLKAFHTGSSDILNLDPTEARSFDSVGTGTWFSDSPEVSSSYARIKAEDSPAMYPMLLKTDGMYSADAGGLYWSDMGDAVYRDADGKVLDAPFTFNATTDNFANDARKRGASGLIIDNVVDTGPDYKSMRAAIEGQGKNYMDFLADYQKSGVRNVSVQDPSAARSLLGAAFDPDQTGSSNILASRAVPTAAAGLLGLSALGQSDDAEAARIPKNVVEGYKLFRTKPDDEGLYPLFVDSNTPVNVGEWTDAKAGEMAKDGKKVKSKIGPLAYRAGWHAGDMPMATHIGGKSESGLKAPDYRPASQQWAKIQMGDDYDWQTEAIKRAGRTKDGRIKAVEAHITDQIPEMGHYRYKTNPNMTGEWLIGGEMKVTDLLSPEQVGKIGADTGFPDLPILPEVIKKKGLKFDDLTAEAKKELKQYYPEVYANMTGTKAAPKISAFSGVGAPVAGGGLFALGLTPDEARAAELAATDTRYQDRIEAAKYPMLQTAAGLLGSIDTPIGPMFEGLPNSMQRWAYGEHADLMDLIFAGLEASPVGKPVSKAASKVKGLLD
jgi:hypothetical protein